MSVAKVKKPLLGNRPQARRDADTGLPTALRPGLPLHDRPVEPWRDQPKRTVTPALLWPTPGGLPSDTLTLMSLPVAVPRKTAV